MGTPTGSFTKGFPNNFSPLSTPQHSGVFRASSVSSPSKAKINGKGKAPDRLPYSMFDDLEEVEKMKKIAQSFVQKSLLVRESFRKWVKKTTERAEWHEAIKHSDEYKKKLQSQRLNQSRQSSIMRSTSTRPGTPSDKKRRISLNGLDVSPSKKRAKKRVSGEYRAPRTDEQLAKRFKEVC